MKTISFHSVKGGVGRTAAVVNCANALCNMGKNVVVLELDLDAPGITLKPTVNSSSRSSQGHTKGYIDYLSYFHKNDHLFGDLGKLPNRPNSDTILKDKKEFLQEIALEIKPPKISDVNDNHIKYIIAGEDSQRYWWNLNSPWFHDFFEVSRNDYTEDGHFLLHKNRELFQEELEVFEGLEFIKKNKETENTDFLIVDCKSAREYASVPLYYWSDVVVLMFPHNAEGVHSAVKMEEAIRVCTGDLMGGPDKAAHTIPVVCRVPADSESKLGSDDHTFENYFDAHASRKDIKTREDEEKLLLINPLSVYGINADPKLKKSKLFFIQEAGTGISDESTINDPGKFDAKIRGTYGSYYHELINDHSKVFARIFELMKDSDPLTSSPRTWIDNLIPKRISESRRDRNILMSSRDQAINTDGEKNVLLRNKTVQRLIETLARNVNKSISLPPQASQEGASIKDMMHFSFFQAGYEIGAEFGSDTFRDWQEVNKKDSEAVFEFSHQIERWCHFDSDGAAFGKMTPELIDGSKRIRISWERSFLVAEDRKTSGKKFMISHPSLQFGKGYLLGNIDAYWAVKGAKPTDKMVKKFHAKKPDPGTVSISGKKVNGAPEKDGTHKVPDSKLVFEFDLK